MLSSFLVIQIYITEKSKNTHNLKGKEKHLLSDVAKIW